MKDANISTKLPFIFGIRQLAWIAMFFMFISFGCAKIHKPAPIANSNSNRNSFVNGSVAKIGKYDIKLPQGWKIYKTLHPMLQIIDIDNNISSSTAQLTITRFKRLPGWPRAKKPSDLLNGSIILSRKALKRFNKSLNKNTYLKTHPGINWRLVSKQPEWIFKYPGYSAKYTTYHSSGENRYGEMKYLTFETEQGIYYLSLTIIGARSRNNSELRQSSMKLWSQVISEFKIQSRNLYMVKRRR